MTAGPFFGDLRENAIDEILATFAGSDPAKILRHVASAAFMRGAWAGRSLESCIPINELEQSDTRALLDRIAERKAQEAADPEYQAFRTRHDARRVAREARVQ